MIKKLNEDALYVVLCCFNKIWLTGNLPHSWNHSIVIPILKPGKSPNEPISYRPISLTSNLCKLMEKIITSRLVWYLETNSKFNFYQSGFRQGRSTSDHLIILYNDALYRIKNKGLVEAIFIDLEKAFDMVCHKGLLYNLHDLGINGQLFKWISQFLKKQNFPGTCWVCLVK